MPPPTGRGNHLDVEDHEGQRVQVVLHLELHPRVALGFETALERGFLDLPGLRGARMAERMSGAHANPTANNIMTASSK